MNSTSYYNEIIDLLTPLMPDENARRSLVMLALGPNSPVLRQLNFAGPVEPFILHLLPVLEGYGEVQPGKKALWAVLETARERVGVDKQARIDWLRAVINGPERTTGAPAASGPSAPVVYPGPVKVEFCKRLGDDWRKLADYLGIESWDQARFERGDQGRSLWTWLDNRRRLAELPAASAAIGRQDLADLLLSGGENWRGAFIRAQPSDIGGDIIPHTPEPLPLSPEFQALQDIVCAADRPPDLNLLPATLSEILGHKPCNLTEYRLHRIADWSQPRYELDKRFVQLTLLVDKGEDTQGQRWESSRQFQDLREVLAATLETLALVLLGPPGAGKSTLLRRLEWDLAVDALRDPTADQTRLSFFVPLNQYKSARPGEALPEPRQWLAERWTQRFPHLPPLDDWLSAGKGILLLDALNEMPSAGRQAIDLWKGFLRDMAETCPGNRCIFSCRSLDYSSSLSSKDLPVPHVRIESLSDPQVERFLQVYSPHGDTLWRHLKGTPQLELYRSPIYLKMLVNQADAEGRIPAGRAALFTGFVRQALHREAGADNPRFQADELLTARDCGRIAQHEWKNAYDLPSRGVLFPKLASLAHRMQEQRVASEASQVRIDYDRALALLEHARAEDILKAGVDLGVLDIDVEDVLYIHQLMQEYFAARCLAEAPDAERVRTEWRADRIDLNLAQVVAKLADADPLPPAPVTGWEETTVLAVAMSTNPEAFITALMETNLPLAGRCGAQPDVRLPEALKTHLRGALVERTQEAAADLRARIAAGLALGELGDPRFDRRQGPYGEYLLPPLVKIPGGTYTIGSDEGLYEDEAPAHTVELPPFAIGQFPVTNAEWKRFMDAGGYEDERWWETEAAKAWRRGEGTAEGPKQEWRDDRQYIQQHLDEIRGWPQAGRATSQEVEFWEQIASMTDDEFEEQLDDWYPPGRQTQPAFWNDNAFNTPAQPVVGVCWYEARAYCAWLSAQTGQLFRLPTEAEWEAAARGQAGRRFAYGHDFDPNRCNAFETHIRRTTPIGVFPGGETPESLVDMTGNTWDWTSSLYQPYPYDPKDGREKAEAEGRRVVRGGSWSLGRLNARAPSRIDRRAGRRGNAVGLRVVCAAPIF